MNKIIVHNYFVLTNPGWGELEGLMNERNNPAASGFFLVSGTRKIQGFAWKTGILVAIFLQMAPIVWFSTIPR